jgi:Raf kinase inhibitor-like YbhB/YbcL family protein
MKLTSSAFAAGETIPKEYTADGADVSPPLRWQEAPAGTKAFALICDDPDAPNPDAPKMTWVHWVLYNLPPDVSELQKDVPADKELPTGAKQGTNDFGNIGYGGPAPPRGKPHRYFFKLYAFDAKLDLPAGARKDQVERAMKGHILGKGELMGRYGR